MIEIRGDHWPSFTNAALGQTLICVGSNRDAERMREQSRFGLAIPGHSPYRAPSPDRPAKRHAVAIFECDGPKSILFSY
jgi:hypothetical protein